MIFAAAAFGLAGLSGPGAATERISALLKGATILPPGNYRIGKRRMSCGTAKTVIAPYFPDYGGAVRGLIFLNPGKLRRLPREVRMFVYAHECGHQINGGNESAADCYAVKRGRTERWLSKRGVVRVCQSLFAGRPGDAAHPPGDRRCEAIFRCYADAAPSAKRSLVSAPASEESLR